MNAQQVVTAASSAAQKSDGQKIGQFQTFLCGGALMTIFKEEGISGLWKGNVVACLRLGPYSAVKYFVFENMQEYFQGADGKVAPVKRSVCGALAGSCAVLTTYPLDLVKTRLTVQKEGVGADGTVYKKTYNGTLDCL